MKKELYKILKVIVVIPNLPIMIAISIFFLCKLYNESSATEIAMSEESSEELINKDEAKKYIEKIYPKSLRYLVAFIVYVSIIKYLLM